MAEKRRPLSYLAFRTQLHALDCPDDAEVWIETTIERADNGDFERERAYKIECKQGKVMIHVDDL
jgi:hypothetical protein